MNFSATPDYQSETLDFRFDGIAQNVFARSFRLAEQFCCDKVACETLKNYPPFLVAKFRYGVDVLSRFEAGENSLTLPFSDARAALDIVTFALIYWADIGRDISPLPLCTLALARTVPYALPDVSLPPVDQVFDQIKISDNARNAYETLARWSIAGPPFLTLRAAYELNQALSRLVGGVPTPLTVLNDKLASLSRIFAIAMQVAAEAEFIKSDALRN